MEKICAGIVTYNPLLSDLNASLNQLIQQVPLVIIVDNNSENIQSIQQTIKQYNNVHLIQNTENVGIAAALNQIFVYACEKKYDWVLTLDDDSIITDHFVNILVTEINQNVGIVCSRLRDKKTGVMTSSKTSENKCITAGSLTSVKAWKEIHGFDEWLFIDDVDFDFSMRLYEKGWKIVEAEKAILNHSIGNTIIKNLFFWHPAVRNHSPFRKYYQERNYIYVDYKFKQYNYFKELFRYIKHCFFVLLWEDNKIKKISAMHKGRKEGLQVIRNMKRA